MTTSLTKKDSHPSKGSPASGERSEPRKYRVNTGYGVKLISEQEKETLMDAVMETATETPPRGQQQEWTPEYVQSLCDSANIAEQNKAIATATFGTSHTRKGGDATCQAQMRAGSTVTETSEPIGNAVPKVQSSGTAIPPRLFLNGEVARVRATGRKVVVQSAEWDKGCKCYVYTATPL